MNKKLKEKINESFSSVLPITIIVLVLTTLLVPISLGTIVMFLVGAAMLIVGMGLFSLGADTAMIPIGEGIGIQFTKTKKLWLIVFACFLMGFIITIAEPDLKVLAHQVASVPDNILIYTIAIGVAIFLVISLLRIFFRVNLSKMFIVFYIFMFILSIFVPKEFLAMAFDSGGVTTGPITVPFILALGTGLASIRGDKDSQDDSFGLVALCSIGPILAVMILGICFNPQDSGYEATVIPHVETMQDVVKEFAIQLPHYFADVIKALLPIFAFFIIFQLVFKRFQKPELIRIIVGLVYTTAGLVMFLCGVNVGFIPVGSLLGAKLASESYRWILVPIGLLIGYFIVAAEPAVHILNKQVEEISEGAIPQKIMSLGLSVGVAVSVGLAMIRVLTGISIYWILVPGYLISLLLTFKVPKIFTGIAFDSGGVASGPMTSTFLLPFTMGACEALGGNVLTDAFGVVAFVAMTPLIAIQLMGLIYMKASTKAVEAETEEAYEDEIVEYDDDASDNLGGN